MFFVAVGTNHQRKNLKCGGCTWYQPAEVYTYVRYVPDTYVPGISRLSRYVYDTRYVDASTRYVCTWYQPATQIHMYLVSAGRRTFRPWTHTSDDSYMYQLSLVVATATAVYFLASFSAPWWRLSDGCHLSDGRHLTHNYGTYVAPYSPQATVDLMLTRIHTTTDHRRGHEGSEQELAYGAGAEHWAV